jgi:uncharacterized protein (DUF302 family)
METNDQDRGINTIAASSGVDEALDFLEKLAKNKGMTIFSRINFSQDAAAAGLTLRPMQLLILGNPRSGTLLMAAAPLAALDFPLKVLAWEDEARRCWLSYNSPDYLQQRHGFAAALKANISGLATLVEAAARGP